MALSQIGAGGVGAGAITANTVLTTGVITADLIATGAVGPTEIATGGVSANTKIGSGAITAVNLAADSISAVKIQGNAVGASEISANAIGTSELASGALSGQTFSGNVTIGGTLTYEDVTNIDSVGLVTARTGIEIGARPGVAASISVDGNAIFSGITTIGGASKFGGNMQMTSGNPEFEFNNGGPRLRVPSANTLSIFTTGGFGTTTNERIRITSSGQVLVGSNSLNADIAASVGSHLQVEGTTYQTSSLALINNQASTDPAFLVFGKSRAGSNGGVTVVQSDDRLGGIRFAGADGTDLHSYAAEIGAVVGGTPGSNDMPGRLIFSTTPDGSNSPSERLRIGPSGNVSVGSAVNAGDTLRYFDVALSLLSLATQYNSYVPSMAVLGNVGV